MSSDNSTHSWYVVRTKPQKEQVARLNYEKQGYSVYLPQISKTIRHARRKQRVLRPFFPGYLFLHLRPDASDWVAISSTRGAVGPICFEGCYVPVPDWIIENIRQKQDETGAVPHSSLEMQKLQPGSKVIVNLNDDTSTNGILYSVKGEENVVVLLDFMSRRVKTSVHFDQVQMV